MSQYVVTPNKFSRRKRREAIASDCAHIPYVKILDTPLFIAEAFQLHCARLDETESWILHIVHDTLSKE
jgi:hypothetical protein